MFLWLVVFLCVIWGLYQKCRNRKIVKLSKILKSNLRSLPFIGHTYMLLGNSEVKMKALQLMGRDAIKQGGLTSLWHTSTLYIMVADPKVAEVICKSCLEKDDSVKVLHFFIGNGSVFAPVNIWRPRRKFLAPTFNVKNLNNFVEVFARQSSYTAENILKEGKDSFSIWKYITTYTMDAVSETVLGIQIGAQKNSDQPFLKSLEELCTVAVTRLCEPWLQNESIFKVLPIYRKATINRDIIYDMIDKIIKDTRAKAERLKTDEIESTGLKSFMEMLTQASKDMSSDVAIREECIVFLAAGTDTSAVGGSFTILLLSKHLDVQEKVYDELKEVFGDSDRPVAVEDLPRLKYLEAVIKESFRLYPPVPVIARKIDTEVELPSGLKLIPGCGCLINIWAIHRHPHYWGDDAEVFRPERFIETPSNTALMTFSCAPRGCTGNQYAMMSMKTLLATLFRKIKFLPAAGDEEPFRVKYDLMMRHVDNYRVRMESRKC